MHLCLRVGGRVFVCAFVFFFWGLRLICEQPFKVHVQLIFLQRMIINEYYICCIRSISGGIILGSVVLIGESMPQFSLQKLVILLRAGKLDLKHKRNLTTIIYNTFATRYTNVKTKLQIIV